MISRFLTTAYIAIIEPKKKSTLNKKIISIFIFYALMTTTNLDISLNL